MDQQIVTKVKLSGLHCQACQKLTAKRIQQIPDVVDVHVDLGSAVAEITRSRTTTLEEVNKILEGTNYQAISIVA
ncbi:MAG: hypothetical protein UY21_C0003G0033 [Microgenomates group bacterium GW2011_GWA1_48_10]|nr:MAG: hypothetical protein UY21_C0003G0033 [Microgenomates group bacterium GW2011_GWA1_48_10]